MIEGVVFNPSPLFYVIIGLLVGAILGWVIGFFDSNNRSAKKIEVAETKAERAVSEADQRIAAAVAQARADAPTASTDEPGLLRLKRVNGTPTLEMDGTLLDARSVSADQKKRLIELLTFIRPWVEGGKPPVLPQKPVEPVGPTPAVTQARPAVASQAPSPTQPVSPAVDERNIRSLSIVAQIDTVLQARLVETPLASQGIRLTESPAGGVQVYVGLNKYASIDDVPDAAIQNAIRSAIAEWEQKFTPGI